MNDDDDETISVQDMYATIYSQMKLNPRTVQWYTTEGLLPKPKRIGTEAYYDGSSQLMTRLQVILILQKRMGLKLKDIKYIIERQGEVDWEDFLSFLQALEDTYPRTQVNMSGFEIVKEPGWEMANIAVNWLRNGSHPEGGWLIALETEIEERLAKSVKSEEIPF